MKVYLSCALSKLRWISVPSTVTTSPLSAAHTLGAAAGAGIGANTGTKATNATMTRIFIVLPGTGFALPELYRRCHRMATVIAAKATEYRRPSQGGRCHAQT